jgi:5-deoxy-D-glucuronate isomerase
MALRTLLSPETAPLRTLTLARVVLERTLPVELFPVGQRELLLYSLIGTVRVHLDGIDYGLLGARTAIQTPVVHALRLSGMTAEVLLTLQSPTADLLLAGIPSEAQQAPFVHRDDVYCHSVGTGTHHREVRELLTPPGWKLHAGETLNDVGGWSSWPSHAALDELPRYKEHEECFYVVTPGYGLCRTDGLYSIGLRADGVQEVRNGEAFVTPLGAHEIVASPDAWLWYYWCYTSFLQKTYNSQAHHGVRQYIK